jgi:Immunity protein 42
MIIGRPQSFEIEYRITAIGDAISRNALGCFILHINGASFGLHEPDATPLGPAYADIKKRIARRGLHTVPFAAHPNAGEIIDTIYEGMYYLEPMHDSFFGIPGEEFSDLVQESRCQWHRYCGSAFDDGSGIRHFDVGDMVRLIADKPPPVDWTRCKEWKHDPATLVDIWITADDFYSVLAEWVNAYEKDWAPIRRGLADFC